MVTSSDPSKPRNSILIIIVASSSTQYGVHTLGLKTWPRLFRRHNAETSLFSTFMILLLRIFLVSKNFTRLYQMLLFHTSLQGLGWSLMFFPTYLKLMCSLKLIINCFGYYVTRTNRKAKSERRHSLIPTNLNSFELSSFQKTQTWQSAAYASPQLPNLLLPLR